MNSCRSLSRALSALSRSKGTQARHALACSSSLASSSPLPLRRSAPLTPPTSPLLPAHVQSDHAPAIGPTHLSPPSAHRSFSLPALSQSSPLSLTLHSSFSPSRTVLSLTPTAAASMTTMTAATGGSSSSDDVAAQSSTPPASTTSTSASSKRQGWTWCRAGDDLLTSTPWR